jgi:hypothetical protein
MLAALSNPYGRIVRDHSRRYKLHVALDEQNEDGWQQE